jgi:hypothetical protein
MSTRNIPPAPTTGQGQEFFNNLRVWEMKERELRRLPGEYFGDTLPSGALVEADITTETFHTGWTTREYPVAICDCGWDD